MKKQEVTRIVVDPLSGRAAVFAARRGERPMSHDKSGKRDFLASIEARETVLEQRGQNPNWRIRVVANMYPSFTEFDKAAYGHQELVVEGRDPDATFGGMAPASVREIVDVWAGRTAKHMADPRIGYVVAFRSWGLASGASIGHPHSQLYATSFVPPWLLNEARLAARQRIHPLLAQARKLRGTKLVVAERAGLLAFCPPVSRFPYETWIVPLRRVDNITELSPAERSGLAALLRNLARTLEKHGTSFNINCHQLVRVTGEQLVVHVTPRRTIPAGLELDAEMYLNPVFPERAAALLRRGML